MAELALIKVEQAMHAMPCLFHCKNFHVLLQHGMRRYGNPDSVKQTSFLLAIKKVMMVEVLGTLTNPAQWRC